jgi:hypothetical protein
MSIFIFCPWRQTNYKKPFSIWNFLHLSIILCLYPQLSWLNICYWLYDMQTGSWFSTDNLLFHLLSFKVLASSSASLIEKTLSSRLRSPCHTPFRIELV